MLAAVKQVAGPSFFALLVIAVSFLPVLTLEAQEGRLFKPLAYTKTLAMVVAAVLAITLGPGAAAAADAPEELQFPARAGCARLANAVVVGRIHSEEKHPISRVLIRLYEPVVAWTLRWKWVVIAAAAGPGGGDRAGFLKLGSEFMPPLDEGSLLYMPSTMPGISITEAQQAAAGHRPDHQAVSRSGPGAGQGRAGPRPRPIPAPLSMLETVIILKPKSQWRHVDTWYSSWAPEWAKSVFRHITPDHISQEQLVNQMNEALKIPGVSNAWTMPIKGRIDMLTHRHANAGRAQDLRC